MATDLITVGHGTASQAEFTRLLHGTGVTRLVDVRRYPVSRAYLHVGREALIPWLPAAGVDYRWEERLGGRRRLPAESPDKWWRVDAFRAYANHMRSAEFLEAISSLLAELQTATTAVMCSESQWWRCHRRVILRGRHCAGGVGSRSTPHAYAPHPQGVRRCLPRRPRGPRGADGGGASGGTLAADAQRR
jgi:hypothetical protein